MDKTNKKTFNLLLLFFIVPFLITALAISVTLAYYSDSKETSGTIIVGQIGTPVLATKTISGLVYPGNANTITIAIQNPSYINVFERNTSVFAAIELTGIIIDNTNITTGAQGAPGSATTNIKECFRIKKVTAGSNWMQTEETVPNDEYGGLTFLYKLQLAPGATTTNLTFDIEARGGYSQTSEKPSGSLGTGPPAAAGPSQWYTILALLESGTVKAQFRVEFLQAPYNFTTAGGYTTFKNTEGTTLFAKFPLGIPV